MDGNNRHKIGEATRGKKASGTEGGKTQVRVLVKGITDIKKGMGQ